MINKREKELQAFGAFLSDFVRDLNHRFEDGWALLVEGRRDERALRELGYKGRIATVSSFSRLGRKAFGGAEGVIILTDFDREGRTLASRFVKRLSHDGISTSLAERRRLNAASKGLFLHVENLSRFTQTAERAPGSILLTEVSNDPAS